MNMVSLLRNLNLNKEDQQALLSLAALRLPEIEVVVGSRNMEDRHTSTSRLQRGHTVSTLGQAKVSELLVANALNHMGEDGWEVPHDAVERDERTQAYTAHPSFAGVYHSKPSGGDFPLVGSVGMDNSVDSLEFKRVALNNKINDYQVDLQEVKAFLSINLSLDQMAILTRNTSAESPCAICRMDNQFIDAPPALGKTTTKEDDVREKTMALGRPLLERANELEAFLLNTPKISAKDDYARLQAHVQAMRDAIDAMKGPMRELMSTIAGDVERATMRQLISEMAGPAVALGVSIQDLLE